MSMNICVISKSSRVLKKCLYTTSETFFKITSCIISKTDTMPNEATYDEQILFLIPCGKTRQFIIESYVTYYLSNRNCDHWYVLTSLEREQYWHTLNDNYQTLLKPLLKTNQPSTIPPCVSVVTFEKMGLFIGQQNVEKAVLIVDEAHILVQYLRNYPSMLQYFHRFKKVLHFTYHLRVCNFGYLLETDKDIQQKIKQFPIGDDDEIQKKFGNNMNQLTIARFVASGNRILFNHAMTSAIVFNAYILFPGLNKWSNRITDE